MSDQTTQPVSGPRRGLVCPKCNNTNRCGPASCGSCKNCRSMIAYMSNSYCASCSWQLESCYACGQSLREGQAYIDDLDRGIANCQKRVDQVTQNLATFKASQEESPDDDAFFQRGLKHYEDQLANCKFQLEQRSKLREKLPTMTREDLLAVLREETRL